MDLLTDESHKLINLQQKQIETIQLIEEHITQLIYQNKLYNNIRLDFGEIIESVLDRAAVLSCNLNNKGSQLEFQAEILDESGITPSADDGHIYRKLLCIAFDIAVFSAYLDKSFIHFVFHDGVFESFDHRKKQCLLHEIRKHCNNGLQQIITVIESDLPPNKDEKQLVFSSDEIIRVLHDQGDNGRLFHMDSW